MYRVSPDSGVPCKEFHLILDMLALLDLLRVTQGAI